MNSITIIADLAPGGKPALARDLGEEIAAMAITDHEMARVLRRSAYLTARGHRIVRVMNDDIYRRRRSRSGQIYSI